MDKELAKVYAEFCRIKDAMNSGNVTEKTVDIIGRFGKAIKNAEIIVLDPPKVKKREVVIPSIKDFIPLTAKELEDVKAKLKPKQKAKPGPKPKK